MVKLSPKIVTNFLLSSFDLHFLQGQNNIIGREVKTIINSFFFFFFGWEQGKESTVQRHFTLRFWKEGEEQD